MLAAIADQHRRAGLLWSAADPVIATVMRGILRAQKRPVRPAAALTSADIKQLLATCDDGLIGRAAIGRAALPGLRDRALLLVCFAGGLRRSELVALDREDLTFSKDGLTLRIRHSKSDQEGEGADVLIARGLQTTTCPVRAMELWLQRSRIGLWCNLLDPLSSRLSGGFEGDAMTSFLGLKELFEGRHFDREVIVLCVRCYLRFKLSCRDLVERMVERGLSIAHTTIMRWVHHYVPELERRWNRFAQPAGLSWRVDET